MSILFSLFGSLLPPREFLTVLFLAFIASASPLKAGNDILLIGDLRKPVIYSVDLKTRECREIPVGNEATGVFGITCTPSGEIFVSHPETKTISKLSASGDLLVSFTTGEKPAYGITFVNDQLWANVGDAACALVNFKPDGSPGDVVASWGNIGTTRGLAHFGSNFYAASFGNSQVVSMSDLGGNPQWVEAVSARALDLCFSEVGDRFTTYQGVSAADYHDSEEPRPAAGVYVNGRAEAVIGDFIPFGITSGSDHIYVADVDKKCIRVFDIATYKESEAIELPSNASPGFLYIQNASK